MNTEKENSTELAHITWLRKHGACAEGIAFASKYPTLQAAWDACTIIEHLHWVALTGVEESAGCRLADMSEREWELARPIAVARDEADDTADPCGTFRELIRCPEIKS